jgi:HlyD family secretion protein
VRGKVDEADIGVVKMGMPSRIKVETFKDKTFDGTVTQISPLGVDKDNVVTFEVKVSISNPGGELRANMTANAEIVLEEHKDVVLVPESAVVYDAQRNASVEFPAPAQPKGKEKKPIKVGISNGTRTEVLEGLKEGEKVILVGSMSLRIREPRQTEVCRTVSAGGKFDTPQRNQDEVVAGAH